MSIEVNYDAIGYLESLKASKELYDRASLVEPAGVQGAGRYYPPRPVYIKKAKGARLWDVDGNEYIDTHGSYGPALLGYSDDRVRAAVEEVLRNEGVLYALPHPREAELAETLTRLVPAADKAIFTCEGTTAVYHAVRVARAYSGKSGLLKFEGAYHGWVDEFFASAWVSPLDGVGPARRPNLAGGSAGRLAGSWDHLYVAPWNDLEATQAIAREHQDDIGIIMVEPVLQRHILPEPGFLEGLRALADEMGAVLIFDDVFCGFRSGMHGTGALFGVTPDITVFGKAMANGFPIGCAVGRKDIMALIGPAGPVYFSGTFVGNPLTIAAAQETIRILEEERVAEVVNELGEEFAKVVNDGIKKLGVPALLRHWHTCWHLLWRPTPARTFRDLIKFLSSRFIKAASGLPGSKLARDYSHFMLANGVYVQPYYIPRACISYAHTQADLELIAELTLAFLERNAAEVEKAAKAAME